MQAFYTKKIIITGEKIYFFFAIVSGHLSQIIIYTQKPIPFFLANNKFNLSLRAAVGCFSPAAKG